MCITALVHFAAEIYGHNEGKGPYMYVGETIHPPRLFAVICGNSSKARKGTSRYPVEKLFSREHCKPAHITAWGLPAPVRNSGGPLSTGEGLAHQVREESEEERERRRKLNPNEPFRDPGDKRLLIQDEEFASGLACTKREGNTLSMGIRCFWDSGDYSPLTKNNPITVKGAHICILTHITMQELSVLLGEVQAFNGFGNRFLWICARRSKLVALPPRMAMDTLAPLQNEIWRLVGHAQRCGSMSMTSRAKDLWQSIYPELSKEHSGLAGSIINRAEAQTLRLALVYALLDGQCEMEDRHLQAGLAMWNYAQESALYIFGDRAADPLEQKILALLATGKKTGTELNKHFGGHISKEKLQYVLQELEARRYISLTLQQFDALRKSLSESSQNALSTTESAILHQLANLEKNVISRCRIVCAAFGWKCLQALTITVCILLGAIFSGWGMLSLAENKITKLHREITTLSERKETLEAESSRIWATFKGLEPYTWESKDYLLTPEGWTISHGGTVKNRDAWRIVRK